MEVVRRRPDHYHEIRTLFQSVSLHDVLEFEWKPGSEISLRGNEPSIPWTEDNLIFRAARLLQNETGAADGVSIRVDKNIPAGKGLGGGSSNAARSPLGLEQALGSGAEENDLEDLGGCIRVRMCPIS